MGFSKVQIYNLALANLGVTATIQSTTQAETKTITLNSFYEPALQQVLKDFDWNFARGYKQLTPTGNECLNPKYSYEYDYPNDCINAREIVTGATPDNIPFEIASNQLGQVVINTNISPATLRYTKIVDKEAFFTSEFVMAFSWYLSFLVAESLTGNSGKREKALAIYNGLISSAQIANSTEGYEEEQINVSWMDAR